MLRVATFALACVVPLGAGLRADPSAPVTRGGGARPGGHEEARIIQTDCGEPELPMVSRRLRESLELLRPRLPGQVLSAIATAQEGAAAQELALELSGTTRLFRMDVPSFMTPECWAFTFASEGGRLFASLRTWTQFGGWAGPESFELEPFFQSGAFFSLHGVATVHFPDCVGTVGTGFRIVNGTVFSMVTMQAPLPAGMRQFGSQVMAEMTPTETFHAWWA